MNAEELHLSKFISPDYPPRTTKASIQGRVELELIADPVSGVVKETRLIRGHPLFHESALAAARMWRFDTSQQVLDKPVKAVLDYLWACPPEQPLTPPAFAAPESSNRR